MRMPSCAIPRASPRPCLVPRCPGFAQANGRCTAHQGRAPRRERDAQFDQARAADQPWRKWYRTKRWLGLRDEVLARDPLCCCDRCQRGARRVTPSTVVDHIVPHRGDPELFWDRTNLQGLAKTCHDAKTRREGRV